MAEHTPTPWVIVDGTEIISSDNDARREFGVIADTNLLGPKTDQQAADTEFIVRACNAHDELVAAIENIVSCYGYGWKGPGEFADALEPLIADAQFVIRKARGE